MGVQGSMGMTGDEDRGKHGTPGYQGSGYGPNPHETPGRYWSHPFLCPLPGKRKTNISSFSGTARAAKGERGMNCPQC